jgi:DNA-binding NtrC family response regulator
MSSTAKVLFVDDEENIVNTLRMLCKSKFTVFTATSGAKALEIIRDNQIHVIVSDQRMPEMQGIELLREVRQISPQTMRIMLTGYADLAAVVGSINDGEIYRYIYKPWNNKDVVDTIDAAAVTALALAESQDAPDVPVDADLHPGILVIDDEQEVYQAVEKLFTGRCKVSFASSCAQALDVLERENIAVIVSDVFVAKQDVTPFIKILKEQHPSIVSIVLTKFNDANMVVGLINHGQIYRFLGKPLHQAQLRVSLEAALLYYAKCHRQPKLLSRHRVERMEMAANPSFTAMLMTRLRSLRGATAATAGR